MFEQRRVKAAARMAEAGLDALIVSDPVSIWYLSGLMVHPGERMLALVLEADRETLFVNRLFPVKAPAGLAMVSFSDTEDPVALLAQQCRQLGGLGGRAHHQGDHQIFPIARDRMANRPALMPGRPRPGWHRPRRPAGAGPAAPPGPRPRPGARGSRRG